MRNRNPKCHFHSTFPQRGGDPQFRLCIVVVATTTNLLSLLWKPLLEKTRRTMNADWNVLCFVRKYDIHWPQTRTSWKLSLQFEMNSASAKPHVPSHFNRYEIDFSRTQINLTIISHDDLLLRDSIFTCANQDLIYSYSVYLLHKRPVYKFFPCILEKHSSPKS